jgi:hypothetical protein
VIFKIQSLLYVIGLLWFFYKYGIILLNRLNIVCAEKRSVYMDGLKKVQRYMSIMPVIKALTPRGADGGIKPPPFFVSAAFIVRRALSILSM